MYAMNRLSPNGILFHLMEQPEGGTKITHNHKSIIVPYDINQISRAWFIWQMNREHVQVAFKFMNPAEREFLLTAITPDEWNATFGTEED